MRQLSKKDNDVFFIFAICISKYFDPKYIVLFTVGENLKNLMMQVKEEMCLMKSLLLRNFWLYQTLERLSQHPFLIMWYVNFLC